MVGASVRRPRAVGPSADPETEFLRLACLVYGRPVSAEAATRLLAARPEIAGASVWTRAAVGDAAGIARVIAVDPAAARACGGPFGWEPLVYPALSRVAQVDAVGVARVLLAAGADANDGRVLHNRGVGGDDIGYLEVLLGFGLGRGDGGPWKARLGRVQDSPARMLANAVLAAASRAGGGGGGSPGERVGSADV
ncbi:hypothetical protein [Nonomuraea rhodomycinica]|uniref:Ankyrin repeat-containing protein n=1 Tax=Nonomuraea rhodomycinica TaxID=1712872 RepID=A0A7Y6II66_9ACTN|nr:hypothetical protein [Nonomuraea rhodomycinica]NUW38577.1 hypothetical protein [Nonomuraea rhodomycinica]